ncbi:MAG TPA: porin family protein [Hyphomonadaceae bacterium]|nr:porin family protein [Hyphomonadaceae bacterium]
MKRTILAAAAGAAMMILCAPASFAQVHADVGITGLQVDQQGSDATLAGITGRLGYEINPFIGVEGELTFGIKDDKILGNKVKLNDQVGAFVRGHVPIGPLGSIYARAGYADTDIDSDFVAVGDGAGFAYGGGIELDVLGPARLRLDYTHYRDKVGSLGLAAELKF